MTNNAMVSVEIPEGYELADTKMRPAKKGEWLINKDGRTELWNGLSVNNWNYVILRPIAPAYVTVKVRRVIASTFGAGNRLEEVREEVAAAMREALEAKPCGKSFPYFDGTSAPHVRECALPAEHA